ncbi:MAG TPA: HAD family hydrolase [Mycobacteriales bacterium]|nr:HAD family hydrolase [Mycobacteriales bacterium]
MPVDAVVFDWGGTLTPFHAVDLLDAWRAAAEVLAPDRADEVAEVLLAVERSSWRRVESTMESATTGAILREASAAVGLPVDEVLHERALARYLDDWAPTTVARPEAVDVLQRLRRQRLRTGLLSNTHWPADRHEEFLRRDGLLDLIDTRIYTSELEVVKPHPTTFTAVLDRLGTEPRSAVFVGDRRFDDIWGAQQVGMRTVWLRNEMTPPAEVEPDAVIDELAELPDVVARWL